MKTRGNGIVGYNIQTAVADRGYYKSDEILACEQVGITPVLPRPQTSDKRLKELFGRDRFHFQPDSNTYRCPAGVNRPARSRTSGEYLDLLLMTPSSQRLESPEKSGRFKRLK